MLVRRGQEEGENLPGIEKRALFRELCLLGFLFGVHTGCRSTIRLGSSCVLFPDGLVCSWEAKSQGCLFSRTDQEERRRTRRSWAERSKGGPALFAQPCQWQCPCASHLTVKEMPKNPEPNKTQKPHGDT